MIGADLRLYSEKELDAYADYLLVLRQKPNVFLDDVLGATLRWDGQERIMKSVVANRRTVVPSGNALGKDWLAARLLLWFLVSFPPAICIATGPTDRQVDAVVWGELAEAYNKAKIPIGGRLLTKELIMDEKERWYAMGFTTKDVHREQGGQGKFQGFHQRNVLIVFTEAQAIERSIWGQAETLMTAGHARFLAIGNPLVNYGAFYENCQPGSGWHVERLDCEESPNVITGKEIIPGMATRAWVDEMAAKYGKDSPTYRSKVRGFFPPSSADIPIDIAWLEDARKRYALDIASPGAVRVGCDPAGDGKNKTVIAVRRGMKLEKLMKWERQRPIDTKGEIVQLLQAGAEKVFLDVAGGWGASIYDLLLVDGYGGRVVAVNNGSTPSDEGDEADPKLTKREQYANVGTQMWAHLAWLLQNGYVAMDYDEDLQKQLLTRRMLVTEKGKRMVEPKKQYAKRGYDSPDEADAVCLAFAEDDVGMRGASEAPAEEIDESDAYNI